MARYIRSESDWVSAREGGTVYRSDRWGLENQTTGGRAPLRFRPDDDSGMTYAMRCSGSLAAAAAVCLLACLMSDAAAENEDWRALQRRFQDTWKIGGARDPAIRVTLRGRKREAVRLLAGARDGRAVPVLISAHKGQLKFVHKLQKAWAKRKADHDKQAPAMERALQKKKVQPGGGILVTPAEQAWIDEKGRVEKLYTEVLDEKRIAQRTREAMGRVLGEIDGTERTVALKALLKEAGRGQSPEEREFVRLLGYVAGADVTEALRRYAQDVQPLVAQAALEALGRQNHPGSIDLLLERLTDPRWQIRVSALLGLSFYREERVVDALLERVDQESGVLHRHYLTALARMVGEEADLPTSIPAWRTWWRKNRAAVRDAWRTGERLGPVEDDLPAVRIDAEGEGSTSFYGIKTDSKHVIFVIDISGSMGEHGGTNAQGQMRIDIAKRELKNAIRSLSASDERGKASFNVVAYAADVRVYKAGKMIAATKANKEKAFSWIDALPAIGATNIYDALEQAFLIIDSRRMSKQLARGADTIFLMTDGKPNRGKIIEPKLIREEIAKMNRDRRITIHTVGVGPDHNRGFLDELAAENYGQYLAR